MRCFIAAWPDEPTRIALSSLSDDVRQHAEHRRVSSPNDLHLTLAFIGDVVDEIAFELSDAIAKLAFKPFALQLDSFGFFREADVVWIGAHETPQPLADLADRVRALLDRMSVTYDRRPLVPHVTLLHGVKSFAPQKIAPIRWRIASIAVYRSNPASGAARYASVER